MCQTFIDIVTYASASKKGKRGNQYSGWLFTSVPQVVLWDFFELLLFIQWEFLFDKGGGAAKKGENPARLVKIRTAV